MRIWLQKFKCSYEESDLTWCVWQQQCTLCSHKKKKKSLYFHSHV